MLGLSCLLKHPAIRQDIETLMKYEVLFTFPLTAKKATFENVFNHLRKQGVEIDIQTAGHIYMNAFDLTDSRYTPQHQVAASMGSTYARIIAKQQAVVRASEIGRDSAVTAAVAHLANLVQPDSRMNPTVQKIMQDRLKKAARRVLEVRGKLFQKQGMEEILREALQLEDHNKFKIPIGNGLSITRYMENAQTLWAEFQKEIDEMATEMDAHNSFGAAELREHADQLQQASYDLFLSNREVQQVLQQVLKESGFSRVGKVNGKDQLVTDWKSILESSWDFQKDMTDILLKQGFTAAEAARIVPFFEKQYQQLMQDKIGNGLKGVSSAHNSDVERLARLSALGGFQVAEKKALYNILGVDKLQQGQLDNLEKLMITYNDMMKMNMSNWSPTFFKTIERYLRNTLERTQEANSTTLNAVRRWQLYSQFSAASILVNIGNALIENTTSGFAEMINTMVVDPNSIKAAAKSWATVFGDVVKGGVRQGVEKSNVNDDSVNLTDRTSWEEAKTFKEKAFSVLNMFERSTLSAFDASAKAYLWKSMELNILRQVLQAKGMTKVEANAVLNEAYYGNRAQIEGLANTMIAALNKAGIKTTETKKNRIMGELYMANLSSDGGYFTSLLNGLAAKGKLEQSKVGITINNDVLEAVRKVADAVAARGVGHSGDVKLVSLFDRKIESMHSSKAKGTNLKAQASMELTRSSLSNLLRFRSGMLRWVFLNFYKSSGLGLAATLIGDMAIQKQHDLLRNSRLQDRLNDLEAIRLTGSQSTYDEAHKAFANDLEKAYAVRQRLARAAVQPILSFAIFNFVLRPAIEGMMKGVCHDNTEECIQKKMILVKEMGWDNIISKLFPIAAQNYVNQLVVHKPSGSDYYHYEANDKAAKTDVGTYLETVTHPLPAIGSFIKNNIGQDPLYGPIQTIAEDISRGKMDAASVAAGQLTGKFLNLGGPLKMSDINGRYINTFTGVNNHMDKEHFSEQKADVFYEAILKEQMTQGMYEAFVKGIHK